jgi:hypothetical protein
MYLSENYDIFTSLQPWSYPDSKGDLVVLVVILVSFIAYICTPNSNTIIINNSNNKENGDKTKQNNSPVTYCFSGTFYYTLLSNNTEEIN